MDIVLKCEIFVATSFPVLNLNFEMVPSWRQLLKKKGETWELDHLLILVNATNSHCDILTSVSSRKIMKWVKIKL